MKTILFGISCAALDRWPLLLLILGVGLILFYRYYMLAQRSRTFAGTRFPQLIRHNVSVRHTLKTLLFLCGGLCIMVALLRPVLRTKEEVVMQQGRDLYIALDVSRSMLAQDCEPSRLACAKRKIKELVQSLQSERVALILFSGTAFVQCPLTSDYSAFFMFLDAVDVETISSGTTALDKAIVATLDTLASMPLRKHKLLAIFTDGEDFSTHLKALRPRIQKEDLHIFTFGIGSTEGAPIPLYDDHGSMTGYQKESSGKVVISRCNEQFLDDLAVSTGGIALRMTDDNRDIIALKRGVENFEKEEMEEKKVVDFDDCYHYLLFLALLFLGFEWII